MILKLTVFLSVLAWMFIDSINANSSEEDYFTYQYSSDGKPSLKQLLIERVLDPNAFEDNLNKIRLAGLKRARGLEKVPPGFVGVRGKKDKTKVKDPFPGFLGVRGKKSSDRENSSVETLSVVDDIMTPLTRYLQKNYFNLKGKKLY